MDWITRLHRPAADDVEKVGVLALEDDDVLRHIYL